VADGRREEIVAAARGILEAEGPSGLTMRAIAERVGIRAPSLYKHFPDKAALEAALMAVGLAETAEIFEGAIRNADHPLGALARAYRSWALEHPHLYRLMNDQPLPRERLPEGLEARAARPLIEAAGGDLAMARATWGFAHGLTSLELESRFPAGADVDAAWAAGTAAISDQIGRRGPRASRR
jgi:AcrR family transcriptional regulator